jgi:acyl-CoA synthetase (AMP-forming)/AMP-acid ligase II
MNLAAHLLSRAGTTTLIDQAAERQLSSSQLRAAVTAAAGLPELAKRRGEPVLVEVDLTARSLVNLLAVVLSGAVALPVAPKVAARRLARAVELTGADLALLGSGQSPAEGSTAPASPLRSQLAGMPAVQILEFGAPAAGAEQNGEKNAEQDAGQDVDQGLDPADVAHGGDDDPAVILLTSGTTGTPKGVTLTHTNILANLTAIQQVIPIGAQDRLALALPFQYSFGLSTALLTLATGATGVVLPGLQFVGEFIDRLAQAAPTVFAGVPGHYGALLGDGRFGAQTLPTLTTALQAGGPMPEGLTRRFLELFPNASLHLMYGQTEATARLATLPATKALAKPRSVGRALPGVTITVRDPQGRPVGPGEEGELYAVGPNVMAGYWNDPATTAETLTEHGLRTGDMGRLDVDGDIEITGRRSEFAKVRGERVSAREVEDVILEAVGVRDCVVQVGRAPADIDDRLRALVTLVDGEQAVDPPTEQAIRMRIRRAVVTALGPALVPEVVFATELPVTESGKKIRHYDLEAPPTSSAQRGAR